MLPNALILSSARQLEDHPKSTQVVSELLLRACTSKCLQNQSHTQWLSRLASEKNLIKFCEGGEARNRTKNQFIVLWVKTRKKAQTRTQGKSKDSIFYNGIMVCVQGFFFFFANWRSPLPTIPPPPTTHHHRTTTSLTCAHSSETPSLRLSNCQKLLPSLQRLLPSTSGFHLTLKRRDPAALDALHRAHRLHW